MASPERKQGIFAINIRRATIGFFVPFPLLFISSLELGRDLDLNCSRVTTWAHRTSDCETSLSTDGPPSSFFQHDKLPLLLYTPPQSFELFLFLSSLIQIERLRKVSTFLDNSNSNSRGERRESLSYREICFGDRRIRAQRWRLHFTIEFAGCWVWITHDLAIHSVSILVSISAVNHTDLLERRIRTSATKGRPTYNISPFRQQPVNYNSLYTRLRSFDPSIPTNHYRQVS